MGVPEPGPPPVPQEWARRQRRVARRWPAIHAVLLGGGAAFMALRGNWVGAAAWSVLLAFPIWMLAGIRARPGQAADRLLAALGQVPADTPLITADHRHMLAAWWLPNLHEWALVRTCTTEHPSVLEVYRPVPASGRIICNQQVPAATGDGPEGQEGGAFAVVLGPRLGHWGAGWRRARWERAMNAAMAPTDADIDTLIGQLRTAEAAVPD